MALILLLLLVLILFVFGNSKCRRARTAASHFPAAEFALSNWAQGREGVEGRNSAGGLAGASPAGTPVTPLISWNGSSE